MTGTAPPDWRPIESAPKDGTEIIAWGVMAGEPGYTSDEKAWTGIRWSKDGWVTTKPQGRYFVGFHPTHWVPLPPPPQDSA
jgi:hypothetical protein